MVCESSVAAFIMNGFCNIVTSTFARLFKGILGEKKITRRLHRKNIGVGLTGRELKISYLCYYKYLKY